MSFIPLAVFKPVLIEHLKEIKFEFTQQAWYGLSARCGVGHETMGRLFSRTTPSQSSLNFDTADRILTRLSAAYLWHRPPLSDIYWTVPLECKRKGCENELRKRSQSLYCSANCKRWDSVAA